MQRKLHPLEGIVAMCALVFVLALSVGFAQADDSVRKIALRSSSADETRVRKAASCCVDQLTADGVIGSGAGSGWGCAPCNPGPSAVRGLH